jgi:hypothetical protein
VGPPDDIPLLPDFSFPGDFVTGDITDAISNAVMGKTFKLLSIRPNYSTTNSRLRSPMWRRRNSPAPAM